MRPPLRSSAPWALVLAVATLSGCLEQSAHPTGDTSSGLDTAESSLDIESFAWSATEERWRYDATTSSWATRVHLRIFGFLSDERTQEELHELRLRDFDLPNGPDQWGLTLPVVGTPDVIENTTIFLPDMQDSMSWMLAAFDQDIMSDCLIVLGSPELVDHWKSWACHITGP